MDKKSNSFLILMLLTLAAYILFYHKAKLHSVWMSMGGKINNANDDLTIVREESDEVIIKRIVTRTLQLRARCRTRFSTTYHTPISFRYFKHGTPWIYVNHDHKLLYCQTPATGSTGWLKVLAVLAGVLEHDDPTNPRSVYLERMRFSMSNISNRMLREYKKFVVIREPFERLVSAYRNAFLPSENGFKAPEFSKLAEDILRHHYRSRDTELPQLSGSPFFKESLITFREFLTYVTDRHRNAVSHLFQPRHWKPQLDLCYHCAIAYDYIIDFSHIEREANLLMKTLGIPQNISFPLSSNPKKAKKSQKYDDVTMDYLSKTNPRLLSELKKYYKHDYEILGYDTPPQ